ncbi:MAG: Acetyltransferase, GNAT family [uncultured Thermomicrobiales bacterium]|uniref:Acetyltransferase, GNAT family n=1 Tax=uncultured Thermomicrobiales bacterium TaxID=1645740 RepID=A0A6J4VCF0_9BACT|nr:MAG: Acetyltransferase, GNAT family [uncultured Thermomicrobiales bacterium]
MERTGVRGEGAAPIYNIVGERVALGPLRRDLIPTYLRWHNDFHVMRTFDTPRPKTLDWMTAWYERQAVGENALWFTVYEHAGGAPVGHTDLFDIDPRNRTATFGILIGAAAGRGKGYGTETTRLMLDYAFTAVGLHSVMLTTDEYNRAGQRAYARAGFREFGRRRQSTLLAGKLWDTIYMECLATEFASPVLGRVFVPDESRP